MNSPAHHQPLTAFLAKLSQMPRSKTVRDKTEQIRLALAAMLSGGHVLIEDAPGMGKTSLARALGASFAARLETPAMHQ